MVGNESTASQRAMMGRASERRKVGLSHRDSAACTEMAKVRVREGKK